MFLSGRTVIRKEPVGPDAERRLRQELASLERLRGVDGVAQLVETPRCPGSIMLEDAGGTSLAGLAKPLAVDELVGLAAELARAVAGMHRCGVMHRDVSPANIVISDGGAPCLVGFGLATSFAEIRPEFTHDTRIVGTLEYLAPEQTGRTGRSVDQRADLYALGATLYELATGAPPFGSGDPLRLTHDHLARVPVSPSRLNPAVPAPLSEIVMHLLEKEPDHRYQSADGVVHDLEHERARPAGRTLRVGEHDVPLRLLPPSRLVGRDDEVAALQAALEQALGGRCRGVLVGGAPGVGKTALVDELRAVVTARNGWFVPGKFDQYRRDLEFDATNQALRALGRLLLAETDDELAEVRERILAALGANAGLVTAMVPEFAALLAAPPDPGDPLTAQARAQRASLEVLRAVASRERPVVMFVDDLQWAGRTPLGFVDLVLSEEPVEGLLLVGAYREGDVDAAHPLAAPLSRWREHAGVQQLRLANLEVPSLVTMVAEMLHVAPAAAAGLVELIEAHTAGNPYETLELLNALRRDGALLATPAGWRWDEAAVRAHLGQSEVAELLAARVEGMPAPARRLVEAMACLGGRAQPNLLEVATGEPAAAVEVMVEPALDDGVLVLEPGVHQAVQFGHDRIREVILRALDAQRRRVLQLGMARRLAGVPELFAVAAEQYLPVVDAVDDAAERAVVVRLLRRAADQARLIGDYTPVNALLAAALRLIDPAQTATLIEVHTDRHAALYSLGRLDEADEEYRAIEALRPTALQRADARCMQVRSLTIRNRFAEAIELGLDSLRELGVAVPAANRLAAELDDKLDRLHWWLDHTEAADDLARPDITDPTLLATAGLIDAIVPAAYFDDPSVHGWLNGEALGIWLDHGPTRTLLGPVSHVAMAVVTLRGDRAAAYRTMRRILTLGEARGYDPDTSQARHVFAHLAGWFEPIENGAHAAQQAREGLIAGANLAYAGYTYHEASYYLLDCAALDTHVAEIEAGLAFTWRTGSEQTAQWLEPYRRLAGVLRGESSAAAGDEVPIDSYADNPLALLVTHITRGIAAAVFSDPVGLTQHAAAAMPLLAGAPGLYETAIARLLRGLALAEQSRATGGDERRDLLSELEELARWLAARAADAPDNFLHLLRLLEAERAWALGDFRAAALAFDTARRDVAGRRRPWHQALITERAARFHLAHGLERAGYDLLTEARQEYLDWGATAKVSQLDWAYPALRPQGSDRTADLPDGRSGMTTGTIDLLGILSASQALSSETSIERLHARVAKILSEMTGATGVDLLLWSDDRQDWDIPEARSDGAVPMSVLRYVQRMPEPLVVSDATSDDRFARDPYFADLDCCSLLVVPILSRGTPRAVLLLENRLIRGAFSTERLDGAKLIAGQLAVSLDNAQLYAEFRRIADEQAALGRVATLVARGGPAAEVFEAVANEARRVLDLDGSSLIRFESDGSATLVAADTRLPLLLEIGEPLMLDASTTAAEVQRTAKPVRRDYAATAGPMSRELHRLGYRGSVGAPIVVEGRVWGVMLASWAAGRAIPPDSERRLVQFTELVATAVGNAHSRAELSASRARLVATADETRRRIERDLHDGAQQRLVSLALQVRAARAAVPPGVGAELDSVADGLTGALDELRELARGIHPAILTEGGLGRALRVLARRSSVPVELDAPSSSRLPEPVEVAAYYVVSEALTNAAKHANASAVTVSVKADDANHLLRVAVRDNGAGGANFTDGTGLVGLRDRVEALGGRILLESPQGAGTSLHVELPLTATNSGRLR